MQLPLLNRFQGGLLGAWIGASFVEDNPWQIHDQLLPWMKLAMMITKRLINSGQIREEDWPEILGQHREHLNVPVSGGALALATLPLALFFHECPSQFREYLYSLNGVGKQSQETLEEVIIWQDALVLILREKLDSRSLVPELLTRHSNKTTSLRKQLEQVQTFLEKKIPLQLAVSQLSRSGQLPPHEIALACYCFSYSSQEFSLCVKRAKRIDYQPSLTATLTGILAGVYNGVSGIPVAWRWELQNDKISQEIYKQATDLLAVWSGVDQPSSLKPLQESAIASPFIIQPRPVVKMISQKEV